ncbi:MAG: YkgJ family cysteine cluster protein [Proteobacteria bacterium]|nr:YkgJ family cysteine cluster protein [Pseudomonadota bacterium]
MEKVTKRPKTGGLSVLKPKDKFRFACHHGLDCFTRCCRDISIFLTPYDILRMKNAVKMSSEDFLRAYTATLISDSGLPVVMLKMQDDEEKSCPFVTRQGCTIYPGRPWSCRIYPLQPESTKITEKKGKEYYSVMDVPFCLGLAEDKVSTVAEWMADQGIPVYTEMEKLFKKITMDEFFGKEKITNKKLQEMFYMASYDLDRFRRFVFKSKFLKLFEMDQDMVEKIKDDDVELYKFAMKWLEYGLLGQHVLKVKPDVMEAKKQELAIK